MKLIVGIGSTWSLRVWLCAQIANVAIELDVVDLTDDAQLAWLKDNSPAGLVPVLDTGAIVIHDSLAIAEYLNEVASGALYPQQQEARAMARSLCAEMHSGFTQLRSTCPFTFAAVPPLDNLTPALGRELARVEAIFSAATLPFMFDAAGAVDAFYAVLAYRLKHYGVVFEGDAGKYQQSLLDWPLMQQAELVAKGW